ncbi:MAG: tetratricopeptide repeat protein [Bacteroidia bacterium]
MMRTMKMNAVLFLLFFFSKSALPFSSDTLEIRRLIRQSDSLQFTAPQKALEYCLLAISIAEKNGERKWLSYTYKWTGDTYDKLGELDKSLAMLNKALANVPVEKQNYATLADIFNSIGLNYSRRGDFNTAIKNYLRSLDYCGMTGDVSHEVYTLQNLAIAYAQTNNVEKSVAAFKKQVDMYKAMGKTKSLADTYINIGAVFDMKPEPDSCLVYYKKAYDILAVSGKTSSMAMLMNNFGKSYFDKGDRTRSLEYFQQALEIRRQLGDKQGLVLSLNNMAEVLHHFGKLEEAIACAEEGYKHASEMGAKELLKSNFSVLADLYSEKGDYKKAYAYRTSYAALSDSLSDAEGIKQIAEMETKYETDKKEKEISLLNKDNEVKNAEIAKEKTFRYSITGFAVLILGLSFALYKGIRNKQRANHALTELNKEIHMQKMVVEEKQKEILDSIYYARRIQRALITSERYIAKNIGRLKDNSF